MARSVQPLPGTISSLPQPLPGSISSPAAPLDLPQGRLGPPPGSWCRRWRRGLGVLAGLIGLPLLVGCGAATVQRRGGDQPLPP